MCALRSGRTFSTAPCRSVQIPLVSLRKSIQAMRAVFAKASSGLCKAYYPLPVFANPSHICLKKTLSRRETGRVMHVIFERSARKDLLKTGKFYDFGAKMTIVIFAVIFYIAVFGNEFCCYRSYNSSSLRGFLYCEDPSVQRSGCVRMRGVGFNPRMFF